MLAGDCPGLLECLEWVPDPRDPRGVRHTLTSLLLAAVAAVLAGARSLSAVGERVADAPPQVLACLGVRRDPLTGRFEPPDEATIRRVLESVDAGALDAAVGSWLGARLRAADQGQRPGQRARRALAVDGKAVRAPVMPAMTVRPCTCGGSRSAGQRGARPASVDGQTSETSEITQFAPLLEPLDLAGCVITADAMHTQRGHAEFLVTGKKAHYILVVKKNRACMPSSRTCPGGTYPPLPASATAGTAATSTALSKPPLSPPGMTKRASRHHVMRPWPGLPWDTGTHAGHLAADAAPERRG